MSTSAPEPSRIVEVAAGVVFYQGRVLLCQRRSDDHLGGLWEFPGGKIEPGETPAACLHRELWEELGIRVGPPEPILTLEHAYPERHVRLHFFRCHLLEGEARPLGCAALAWVTATELHRYDFPAADARLLERLRDNPAWWSTDRTPG